jgi:hypothetical protein
MKQVRLFFDFQCSPFWLREGDSIERNVSVQELPIETSLKYEFEALNDYFQKHFCNLDVPQASGFVTIAEALYFVQTFNALIYRLTIALGDEYEFTFRCYNDPAGLVRETS